MKRKQVSKRLETEEEEQVIETDPLVTQKIFNFLSSLPPGFKFMPTDTELIRDYLRPKIANKPLPICLIHPVNLYRFHPRTLADKYLKHPAGEYMFYFTPRNRKYKNGGRPNRGVDGFGYWKATGKDAKIMLDDKVVGFMKTLVFYEGEARYGKKTNWIMHEYKTCESRKRTSSEDMKLDDWVLCKIREKEEMVQSKNKKNNKEDDVDTNIGDTNTENAIPDANPAEKANTDANTDANPAENANAVENANPDANAVKDEKDTCPNKNDCGTSYQNDLHQSHQNTEYKCSEEWLDFLNTYKGNFDIIEDDNYLFEVFQNELSCVPGTSCSNKVQTNRVPGFIEQWERQLKFENVFACLNFSNFNDSTSGLNINDANEEKQKKLWKS